MRGANRTIWLAEDALWLTVVGRGEASLPETVDEVKPWPEETFAPERSSRGMLRPYAGASAVLDAHVRAGGRPGAERRSAPTGAISNRHILKLMPMGRELTSPHSPNPSPLSVNGEGRGAKG